MSEHNVQREYKATVFSMLYERKEELLELYNGLNGTYHDNPDDLEITTLENAIYMSMKNDASCMIDMSIQLYEQQSTVNPNMPVRLLQYISKVLEKFLTHSNLYGKKIVSLPTPKFYVFYNGLEEQPEHRIMKLSDAFAKKEKQYALEVVVEQYNINPGYNEELKKKCPNLMQYMEYVTRVQKYNKTMSLEQAVNKAVDECIKEGILRDFLLENKAGVISMSIFEYDEEKHKKFLYAEGFEEGREEGIILKLRSLVKKKRAKGYSIPEIADMLEETEETIAEIVKELEITIAKD